MGLDMYLEARKYLSKTDKNEAPNPEYQDVAKLFPAGSDELGSFAGASVEITVGYWRKANAIHAWFVRECADGVDECQPIRVMPGKLTELKVIVEFLLDNKDDPKIGEQVEKLLPTQEGFFFGSTEYDEYYWGDLEHTLNILKKAIELEENDGCSITYQASW